MPSEPRISLEARPGRPTGPAKKLEKWINRKVPIGTPLPFPDFHDVLRCVKEANEENKLGWTDIDVMEEARDLFTRCGKKLQRRRQENEWRIAVSRITAEVDPAEEDIELKNKLEDNKAVAARKETELFNKYVDRQNSLKLEAEEIGDKEAEESPSESEEEDDVIGTDNALELKQKRKQKLKSILKEKNKKDAGKDNVDKDSKGNENTDQTQNEESKDNAQVKVVDNIETIPEKSNDAEKVDEQITTNETEDVKAKEQESDAGEHNNKNEKSDSDNNNVESDIDELHLLQKLHSGSEANTSSFESSDSDSPIAVSDTLDSGSEVDNYKYPCDVISIENSSYSESEMIIDESPDNDDSKSLNKQTDQDFIAAGFEIEYSSTGTHIEAQEEDNITLETEENILLASSDEEGRDKVENMKIEETCINFTDAIISISETIVAGVTVETIMSNDENSVPENNNAIEIVEDSPDSEENDIRDKVVEVTNETVNINESCNKHSASTKDIVEINTQKEINSIEQLPNEQSAITETSNNCEIDIKI